MRGVAVDILTGFLGSGKTTLLRHALTHGLDGQRVAVIMNEIGEIGIDGRVITGLGNVERMVELSNGCICCTIDDYRFDRALQEILETTKPHALIIESTGLADPAALAERVTAAGLGVDAIITVVDAASASLEETAVACRQVAAADFLVLNKVDLVAPDEIERMSATLRRLNPRAEQLRTAWGAIDSDLLFATGVARHRQRAAVAPHHLAADGFRSFVHRTAHSIDADAFTALLDRLPREIVRAKGIVHFVDDDPSYLVNFTCGRYSLAPLPRVRSEGGQMVFIGRTLGKVEPHIRAALAACERTAPTSSLYV